MKKLILFCFLSCFPLLADEPSECYWDYHPIHAGGNFIRIGKAHVDAPEGGHLHYRKTNTFLTMLVPISRESYFFPRVEWNTFTLEWNKNPKFNETHFYYLQFGLTFYTIAIQDWRWILRLDYNIDLEHFNLPGPYGLYTGLIWGAYQIHRKWHYHIGVLGYKGMGGEVVYPIIGLDYAPDKKWLFQAIFPMDYSAQYKIGKYLRLSAKVRPLKERFRAGSREPQPRSIFNYSSVGTELNLHFEIKYRLEFEVFGGYNFGGSFYIKNLKGHDALYTNIGGAPYAGLTLDFGF